MDETLLTKAFENLRVSEMILHNMGDDEVYLNYAGYHLQQAVELSMKYFLENNGLTYPKTHNIEQLILICHKNKISLEKHSYIEEHAEMFSAWESKTRYILGYQLELSKVQRAYSEVKCFLEFIKDISENLECMDSSDKL